MFDKFGEFDSVEELNAAAEGLKAEGDIENIYALAAENGIEREDVMEFVDGYAPELASPYMAALGRIKVQEGEHAKESIMTCMALKVISTMLESMIGEEDIAAAVMKKGKRIKEIYDAMYEDAKKNQIARVGVACGTDEELRNIIRAYFLEGKEAAAKCIENLRN